MNIKRILATSLLLAVLLTAFICPQISLSAVKPAQPIQQVVQSAPDPSVLEVTGSIVITPDTFKDADGNKLTYTSINCISLDKGDTFAVDKGTDLSQFTVTFTGDWTLSSDVTLNTIQVNSGNFDTGRFGINSDFLFIGKDYNTADTISVSLNDSIINCPWWTVYRGLTHLTFNCGTSVINTRNFFGGGQIYNTVNFVNGKSYNLEDNNKIVKVTIDGDSKSTTPLYIRGDNILGNPIVTTSGIVAYKTAYNSSSKEIGQASPIGVPEYQKASITYGKVTIASQIREGFSDLVCWWNGFVSSGGVSADSTPRYWVGNAGNITDDTNHWATVSNGAPGLGNLPTTTNNAVWDSHSFSTTGLSVARNALFSCADFDWSLATNTPTLSGAGEVDFYGNATFISGMISTATGNTLGFNATGTKTLDTGGLTLTFPIRQIAAGTLQLLSNFTSSYSHASTPQLYASVGSIDVNGKIVTLTGDLVYIGVGINYYDLVRTGTAATNNTMTVSTNFSVTHAFTITGNSPSNRPIVNSNTFNTPRTINCTGATTNFTDCDFQDIVISGSPTVGTNVRVGDCGGNTGQTFTAADDKFWVPGATGGTGSWSDATNHWADTDGGGAGANNYPLPQDTAYFTAGSVTAGGKTITMDEPRYSGIDFSSVANTPTVTESNAINHFGSLNLTGVGTFNNGGYTNWFYGRGAFNLTSSSKTFYNLQVYSVSGSVTSLDTLSITNILTVAYGTWSFGNQSASIGALNTVNSPTITLGSGTVTAANNLFWDISAGTVIDSSGSGTVIISSASNAVTKTFNGAGKIYSNLTQQGAGNYTLVISGSNTFTTITVDRSAAAKTLKITNSTTQTVSNFVCATNGIVVLTITNTSGTTAGTLAKSGTGVVSLDYVNVSYNTGSPSVPLTRWFYGANGIPGAGVTGWGVGVPVIDKINGVDLSNIGIIW